MTITFDPSLLLAWYQAKTGVPSTTSTGATTAAAPTVPTAPWRAVVAKSGAGGGAQTSAGPAALTQAALAGSSVINPAAAKLDAPSVADATDYKSLFALYQGLGTLQDLASKAGATKAGATGVGATQQAQYAQAFTRGLGQVQTYLDSAPFKQFQLAQTGTEAKATSTGGTPIETDTYTTQNIYAGAVDGEVPAFQRDVRFSLTATNPTTGAATPVSFDLSALGSTPRTFGNVVNYLNGKLAAAGLQTRFASVLTLGTPSTGSAGGKSFTLPAGPDQYALKIDGSPLETLSFAAPSSTPAVYLTGVESQTDSTVSGGKLTSTTTTTPQLTTLAADPSAAPGAPPIAQAALGPQVAGAQATATGPDGSVYVVENVTGSVGGATVQGSQDVALVKYDSAGNVVFTRTLGAASTASGYAISVSADGSKIAVAGSVTGALDPSQPPVAAGVADSFVSVFDAAGEPQWDQRLNGSTGASQATAVTVRDDGSAFVTGTTQAALPGQAQAGVQDGYLQGFDATGAATFTTEFGGAGINTPAGVALSGSTVVVAGAEDGHAVLRSWALSTSGPPTAGTVRDLGALQGGGVAGVATLADGSIVVAGSTHNGALNAGTVTQAADGGQDAFVARLSADLQPAASDTLSYVGGGADRTVSGLTASSGQVYLTGQVSASPQPGQTKAEDGYALALDPATGAVGWSGSVPGQGGTAAPTGIAVAVGGASVLDKLGLPTAIDYTPSASLLANTGLRAGQSFLVRAGGGPAQAVTVATGDTLQMLSTKIARASGFNLTVAVLPSGGVDRLQITPLNSRTRVEIEAGPSGRNALPALGLAEGVVQAAPAKPPKPVVGAPIADGKTYALGLASTLDISTASGAKAAQTALASAIAKVKLIYAALITPVAAPTAAAGAVPAYLTAQIADYQAALNRLTAGG